MFKFRYVEYPLYNIPLYKSLLLLLAPRKSFDIMALYKSDYYYYYYYYKWQSAAGVMSKLYAIQQCCSCHCLRKQSCDNDSNLLIVIYMPTTTLLFIPYLFRTTRTCKTKLYYHTELHNQLQRVTRWSLLANCRWLRLCQKSALLYKWYRSNLWPSDPKI